MSHKKSREVMFADETTVISSGIQSDRLTSQDLLNVTKWLSSCKLTINIDERPSDRRCPNVLPYLMKN